MKVFRTARVRHYVNKNLLMCVCMYVMLNRDCLIFAENFITHNMIHRCDCVCLLKYARCDCVCLSRLEEQSDLPTHSSARTPGFVVHLPVDLERDISRLLNGSVPR